MSIRYSRINSTKIHSSAQLKCPFFLLALESLEADNFHEDPHADLVMSKKALNLFQEVQHGSEHSSASTSNTLGSSSQVGGATNSISGTSTKASKRRLKTAEYYKQRYVWD